MKSNKLISYRENFLTKILNLFKKIFLTDKNTINKKSNKKTINEKNKKKYFIQDLKIKETSEEKRLKLLQLQYDNGEITEEDITQEDIKKLIEMYEKETKILNNDTEIRKQHIAQMLKGFNLS